MMLTLRVRGWIIFLGKRTRNTNPLREDEIIEETICGKTI
jgi:hypothetical protein